MYFYDKSTNENLIVPDTKDQHTIFYHLTIPIFLSIKSYDNDNITY